MEFDYYKNWDDIIRGWTSKATSSAYGNYSLYNRTWDDVYQDLWVRVLEKSKQYAGTDKDLTLEKNQAYVTLICKNAILDMKNYDEIRNKYSNVDFSDTGSDDDENSDDLSFLASISDDYKYYDSDIDLRALFNRFPKGSKERLFLDFWGNATGAYPNNDAVPPKTRENDGYTNNNLAMMLGFPDQSSSRYRKFKQNMQDIIKKYYEVNT